MLTGAVGQNTDHRQLYRAGSFSAGFLREPAQRSKHRRATDDRQELAPSHTPSACIYRENITVVRPEREVRMRSNSPSTTSEQVNYLRRLESKGLPRRLDTLWHSAAMRHSPTSAAARRRRASTHTKLRCCIAHVTRRACWAAGRSWCPAHK